MNKTLSELSLLGLTVTAQLLIVTLVPAVVAIDVIYLGHGISESSVTEYTQATLVLMAAVLYCWAAKKKPANRGALLLVAGLLGCMFIREQDAALDHILHGAWVYPAWALAIITLAAAYRYKHTILSTVIEFRKQSFFVYLSLGLAILLVFSRVFGTGPLWEAVVPETFDRQIKTTVQEGLELLGYALVLYSVVVYLVQEVFSKNRHFDADN